MSEKKVLCKNCGHPQGDHSLDFFKKYRESYRDPDRAWEKMKNDHPKLVQCSGFTSEIVNEQGY
jgi:hypothetical protein